MSRCLHKISRLLECNRSLNKRAIEIKRAWDEVSFILDSACSRKRHKNCSCKRHKSCSCKK